MAEYKGNNIYDKILRLASDFETCMHIEPNTLYLGLEKYEEYMIFLLQNNLLTNTLNETRCGNMNIVTDNDKPYRISVDYIDYNKPDNLKITIDDIDIYDLLNEFKDEVKNEKELLIDELLYNTTITKRQSEFLMSPSNIDKIDNDLKYLHNEIEFEKFYKNLKEGEEE